MSRASNHSLPPSGPVFAGFDAIEALQEASQEIGWDCEYRQLEGGKLQSSVACRDVARIALVNETADRRLEMVGEAPRDMLTVLVPMPDSRIHINGQRHAGRVILLAPGAAVEAATHGLANSVSMHVPIEMFAATSPCAMSWLSQSGPDKMVDGKAIPLDRIRQLMLLAITAGSDSAAVEDQLLGTAAALLDAARPAADRYHRQRKRLALRRVCDFIEDQSHRPIRMTELCAVAHASLSTLERLFRREFGLTPLAYVRARRLFATRRELRSGAAGDTVADIARRNGFRHLGRFAAAYRSQFGKLPSEDHRMRLPG